MTEDRKKEMKALNMSQLAAHREFLRRNPRLTYLFLELTEQCNLRCLHCGSSCDIGKKDYLDTELLLRALQTVAEDFDPSKIMVCVTGGEPLLHPDFEKIIRKINSLGFPWGMTTNGTLIDQEMAQRLKELRLASVTVSLDGLRESHEGLRQVKGCFDKTMQAIDDLCEAQMPVQVTTVIHKKNFCELDEIYERLRKTEITSWRIINIEPIGRALQNPELLLERDEILALLDYIREKRYSTETPFDVCYGCSHYLSYPYEREVRNNYFLCGSGIYVASILHNGDIYSCLDIERRKELVQGNISVDRFSEVWRNGFQQFRQDRSQQSLLCQNCEERAFCNGDSTHTWDFDKKEPGFCMLRKELYDGRVGE